MTHEEAARILDPETSREALNEIEYYGGFRGDEAVLEAVNEACRIAAEVLRRQPAHIDREALGPCIKCNGKCYFCKFNETSKCGKCKNHEFYSPMFNFCPDCGRPLTEEAWADLEKRMGVR